MHSGSAAYDLVVVVDELSRSKKVITGYNNKQVEGLDLLLEEGLDFFMEIYGTVVDAHYVIDEVSKDRIVPHDEDNEQTQYHCWVQVIITGLTDSEIDFDVTIQEKWPADLVEQINEACDRVESDNLKGYDVNPVNSGPRWSKYNE